MTIRIIPHPDPLLPERRMLIAERLAEAVRARRGSLTYREAAASAGLSHVVLFHAEKKEPPGKIGLFIALLDWTGADPGYVLGLENERGRCCAAAMGEAREQLAEELEGLAERLRPAARAEGRRA